VYLEGNIGAGKSTIGLELEKRRCGFGKWMRLDEPISIWKESGIFQASYEKPKRYLFTFQICVLFTKLIRKLQYGSSIFGNTLLIERSLLSDKYLFMESPSQINNINKIENAVYNYIYNKLIDLYGIFSAWQIKFIIVDTDPAICMKRIRERHRSGELNISDQYLNDLHNQLHNAFIKQIRNYVDEDNIKIINFNGNIKKDEEMKKKILDDIYEFIFK
jgi:deoxyadenosine/deoxycytidine kinase